MRVATGCSGLLYFRFRRLVGRDVPRLVGLCRAGTGSAGTARIGAQVAGLVVKGCEVRLRRGTRRGLMFCYGGVSHRVVKFGH